MIYLAVLFERLRSQGVLLLPQAVFDRILEYDCLNDGNNLEDLQSVSSFYLNSDQAYRSDVDWRTGRGSPPLEIDRRAYFGRNEEGQHNQQGDIDEKKVCTMITVRD